MTKQKKQVKKPVLKKGVCSACWGKGFYTQSYGIRGNGDFIGDKGFEEKPTIHKIPCSKCNGTGKVIKLSKNWGKMNGEKQVKKIKHSKWCKISQDFQKNALGFSICACGERVKKTKKQVKTHECSFATCRNGCIGGINVSPEKKVKSGDIVLDERYEFERPSGYVAFGHVTTEDEIKDICDKNKILISGKIIKYDGYRVIGKKIRIRKTYEKAKKALEIVPVSITPIK